MIDDQDILLAFSFNKGETMAFEEIYNRFYGRLYEFGIAITRDSEEVKDILSYTFNALFYKHTNFNSLPNIKAFLYVTVRNKSIDYLRYKKKMAEKTQDLLYQFQTESTSKFEIDGELLSRLNKSVGELPERSKQVLKMVFYDGLKYEEIAFKLGITVETVKSQRKYALDKLRKSFLEITAFLIILPNIL